MQRLIIQHTRLCGYSTSHPLCVCPANPPPCPAPSVICLLACLLVLLRSLSRSPAALKPRAFVLRAPAECRAASKREKPDAYSLSLGPRASFAPHRIFLALRIAVISAVWPLLLLAMSCMPPSPRDECESGHCGCCKPLRLLSRAASLLLRLSVLLSVRLPAPAIHHHPSMWC